MIPFFRRVRAQLKRHGTIWLWCVSGALAVLGIVLFLVYEVFQGIALHSIARLDSAFSAQTDALSSLMAATVRNYGMQIFYAPSVSQLREDRQISNTDQVRNLRDLNTFVGSSEFVDAIHVYNPAADRIYTTTSNLLSESAAEFGDRSAAELLLHPGLETRMMPIRRIAFEGASGRERIYYSFLFFEVTPGGEPRGGVLMLDVSYSWYVDSLFTYDDQDSCVLLDEAGALIASSSDEAAAWAASFWDEVLALGQEDSGNGYLLRRTDGVQVVCYYSRMQSNGWYCLRVMPLDHSLPGLLGLRNALFAFLAVLTVALAALLLTVLFPFQRIRRALRRTGTNPSPPESQITDLVQTTLEYRRSKQLMAILTDQSEPAIQGLQPPFILLLLDGADLHAVQPLLPEGCLWSAANHGSDSLVVLLHGQEQCKATALCGALTKQTGCRCYCGAQRYSLSELSESYAVLLEMQRLRFRYPGQLLLLEEDYVLPPAHSSFSEREGALLVSALRAGKLEEGRTLWTRIATDVGADSHRDQIFAFKRIAKLLQDCMRELDQPTEALLTDAFLSNMESLAELTARFEPVFQEIASRSIALRRQRIGSIANQVSSLIEDRYGDPNLSPALIADELGMSGAYLGRLFRESMHLSINEFMSNVRINHAASLLVATEQPVEAIAQQVGFGNTKYFYVLFKKKMGQTPLQYRKKAGCSTES